MADGQAVNILVSRHSRHPRGVALALASALLLGGHAFAQQPATTSSFPRAVGPSFDCGSAAAQREPLAQMICTDPGLARLDLTYVQAYQALRHQVGEPNQRDLRREATDFHAAVLARCGVPSPPPAGRPGSAPPPVPQWSPGAARPCVAGLYRAQRQAWLERLVPAAREEAERPLEHHIEVQGLLVELGFLPPGTKVDGNYGPATRGAVAGWQRTRGVEPTGFVSGTDALLLERAVQQARVGAQAEMRAIEESERLQRAQAERREAEARARFAAEARAREEAERQRRAEAEREEAVARLAAVIGGGADEAAVVVTLGQEGSRVRRNLRGELVAMDASRPPAACSILGAQTPIAFADFARERFAGLLAGSGQAFRSPCPFGDDAVRQDVLLLHDLGGARATAPTLVTIARALAEGRAEVVGRVSLSEHRADDERRRREAADGAARLAALSDDIRRDALAGQLADWAAVVLARRPAAVACVVGPPGGDWAEALRAVLPADAAGALQAAVADTDADRQFARLLSGECGMLAARGRDFGDVLRGVAANKREATVLPMRAPAAAVERALRARPEEQHKASAARQAVATPPPASPSPALGLSGPILRTATAAATTSAPRPPSPQERVQAMMPPDQAALVAAVAAARQQYASAANDMAKGASRPARAQAICASLRDRAVDGWIGRVTTLSTNGEGKGVLQVEIAPKASVKTWNNSLSDIGTHTLIEPSSPLFGVVSQLRNGQLVRFSGALFEDTTDCVREASLTLSGSIHEPEFIFRFRSVAAID